MRSIGEQQVWPLQAEGKQMCSWPIAAHLNEGSIECSSGISHRQDADGVAHRHGAPGHEAAHEWPSDLQPPAMLIQKVPAHADAAAVLQRPALLPVRPGMLHATVARVWKQAQADAGAQKEAVHLDPGKELQGKQGTAAASSHGGPGKSCADQTLIPSLMARRRATTQTNGRNAADGIWLPR